jgi:hypothetical protein
VLLAEGEELRQVIEGVEEYCEKWYLEVNIGKTKVTVTSKDREQSAKVQNLKK